jgi:hypothetical protein
MGWGVLLSESRRERFMAKTYLAILPPDEQSTGISDVLIAEPTRESGGQRSTVSQSSTARAEPVVAELPVPEAVKERYLEIRTVPEQQVITVIEILSPGNKLAGEGREQYERKPSKVLGSWTNLVEIDLVRAGRPLPMKRRRRATIGFSSAGACSDPEPPLPDADTRWAASLLSPSTKSR